MLEGDVVRVGDPADVVRVLDVAVLELRGTPAVNGLAHVLFRADHDGEDDEDDGGVQVVEAVDPVIIVATLESGVRGETS